MKLTISAGFLVLALGAPPDSGAAPTTGNFWAYLGGSGLDLVNGVAADPAGNIYLAGETWSDDLPVVGGVQANLGGTTDAFVIKLAPDGQPIYVTYLGGSGFDSGRDIAVDAAGNAYVVGFTASTNFPLQNALDGVRNGNSDAFIAKLNPQGSALLFSTYFGGSNEDNAESVDLDASGNIYVAGRTRSTLTTVNAAQAVYGGNEDAFVLKLANALTSYDYITYLGGDQVDVANAIAVNAAGTACVAGFTASGNFPEVNSSQASAAGSQKAFYAAISSAGNTLLLSSTLGGTGIDAARDVACNAQLLAVVGNTTSTNFLTGTTGTVAIQSALAGETDGFIAAFELTTGDQQLSTYAGGRRTDRFSGVVFTPDGELVAYGDTASSDFPDFDGAPGGLSGAGIFRSTNGGVDWQSLNFDYLVVNELAFAPSTPARMIAATDLGVHVSDDDGATWQRLEDPLAQRVAHTIAVDPEDACIWIAGVDYDPADVTPIGAVRTEDCGESWEAWAVAAHRFKSLRWLPDPTRLVTTVDRAPGFSGGTQSDTCLFSNVGAQLSCLGRGTSANVLAVNPNVNCEWFEGSPFGDVFRVVGETFCDPPLSQFNTNANIGSAVTALEFSPSGSALNAETVLGPPVVEPTLFAGAFSGKVLSWTQDGGWQLEEDLGSEVRALAAIDALALELYLTYANGRLSKCDAAFEKCEILTEDTGSTPFGGIHINGDQLTAYPTRARDLVVKRYQTSFDTAYELWSNDGCESEAAPHGLDVESFSQGPRFYMSLTKANNCSFALGSSPLVIDLTEPSAGDEDVGVLTSPLLINDTISKSGFEPYEPLPESLDGLRFAPVQWEYSE